MLTLSTDLGRHCLRDGRRPTHPRATSSPSPGALLDAEGLEPLTLREIARRGGLSHGAPLRHFRPSRALLAQVAAQGFRELMASIDAATADRRLAGHRAGAAGGRGPRLRPIRARQPRRLRAHVPPRSRRPERCRLPRRRSGSVRPAARTRAGRAVGWLPTRTSPPPTWPSVVWATVHGLAQLHIQGALEGPGGTALDPALDAMSAVLFGVRPAPNSRRRILR